ncbi:signal peptidase I [Arthrobacter sp. PvP102]|uniref:signal peptidase I n=1 Tax=unclassified Arthrobacter TaxID=235627 RepID=UPI001AE2C94D|nr:MULTISPECIES: signal peptidase I [unclassified Arthrobacter]MBP1231782.1 signal peptidase I [Arthrobacter sp. PvP103]MBP1236917.1 signal peptidase I [Arthrobacter sp. PvP102]
MPETDPRTPDPFKHDAGRASAGGDQTGTATDRDTVAPSAGTPDDPSAETGLPAGAGSRAAGSHGAHSKSGPSKAAKEGKAHGAVYLWIKEVLTVVAIAVVLSFLIKTFLFRAFYIPSESMVNTLDVNDRIFVNLLVPEPFALERGDVVVFKDTKGWLVPSPEKTDGPYTWVQDGLTFVGLLPDNSEQHLVKRVIGLPGDHVVCCDAGGKLTINGTAVDETYVNPAEVPDIRNFDVVVPDGKIWVMGDNRNHSADSRAHQDSNGGFIDMPDIEGKAAVIAWPLNRLTGLGNYPDVFRNVPAPAGK